MTTKTLDSYLDELFGSPQVTPPEPGPRSGCLVCDMTTLRAHRDYAICIHCAADITTARARLDARERTAMRLIERESDAYHAAWEAMAEPEQGRWEAFCAARLAVRRAGRHADTVDATTRRRVVEMIAALNRNDQRIPKALRDMYAAGERLYWANAEAAGIGARITRAREELCHIEDQP